MTTTNLEKYHGDFKAAVLGHMHALAPQEWARLRSLAENPKRWVWREKSPSLNATPEALVDKALSEDCISVQETLVPGFKEAATPIANIAGQPVYYVDGQGIYLWGLEPDNGSTLVVWATHPAYPPSW